MRKRTLWIMLLTISVLLIGLPWVTVMAKQSNSLTLDAIQKAPAAVIAADGKAAPPEVKVAREWTGPLCKAKLVNDGKTPIQIKEVVLLDIPHALHPETHLYGEGFTMLSQTGGTLAKPANIGGYADAKHYKIPEPGDATVVYGLLTLSPAEDDHLLLAFSSCNRFIGRFYVRPTSIQAVLDTENLTLQPGHSWQLEEFLFTAGKDRNALLAKLAERIMQHHAPLHTATEPTGWCSWYCFGPRVTSKQVLDNLDTIARDAPGLKYVLVDDGYQPAMGDWLETGPAFGGGVKDVLKQIRDKGFEPALWVA